MAARRSGSILAVDFGNVHTRAVLIDLVDGVYRLVARGQERTTAEFPVGDVKVGLARAVNQLSRITGRKLRGSNELVTIPEQPDRSGVDYFVTTASTGRPLRTVLVGLVPEVSVASGLRASAGTYVDIVETLSLEDTRSEEEQLNAILGSRPDLIFITGGTEGGAKEPVLQLARVVQLAVKLVQRGHKPMVLFAGNSALIPDIRSLFDGLTTVLIAQNVRPSLEEEALETAQLHLALAFDEYRASTGRGFDTIGEISRLGVLPTAQSYNLVVDYLGRTMAGGVLAVDVGSAASTLSASLNGRVHTSIRTDIGLGHSAQQLLDKLGYDAIRRWLPFNASQSEILTYVLNKALRPATIPETLRELYLEHALLRAGIEALLAASRPAWTKAVENHVRAPMPSFDLIIGAGAALTQTGHPAYGAMLLLDALQPTGVTQLRADPFALIPALGALAHTHPEAVVQVLDSYSLERLGTVISVSGEPRAGRRAMKIKIITDDGQTVKQEVQGGHLWVFPLPVGKSVRVEVSAGRGLHINGRGRIKMTLEGGTAGLIFDARGRPLPLAMDARGRAAQLPLWVSEVTGDPVKAIDEAWLAPLKEEKVEEAAPTRRRRGKPEAAPADEFEFEEFETVPEGRAKGTGRLRDLSEAQDSDEDDQKEIGLDDLRGS
jgi:uncharacterized protein (TIGR01319 family)